MIIRFIEIVVFLLIPFWLPIAILLSPFVAIIIAVWVDSKPNGQNTQNTYGTDKK